MNVTSNVTVRSGLVMLALWAVPLVDAQATDSTHAVPVLTLIDAVAKKTGKHFVVDPRVNTDVTLVETDPASIDYGQFLTILQVNGLAAVDGDGLVRVVPDAVVRYLSLPIASAKEDLPDAAYVTKVIHVRSVPAAQVVPLLRPLLPQQAHFAAFPCTNDLLIVDTVGNVKRIEALVQSLDTGAPFKPGNCAAQMETSGESKHRER
jgi:general secretion pathway protein D